MMEWTKTVTLCGFLLMVFLTSGISALKCHSASSVLHNGSRGEIATDFSVSNNKTTCAKGQNACVEAQVKLSIAQTVLLVTHRGCTNKELNDGTGSYSSGDAHFTVKSNVSYCFSDLCNKNMGGDVPWSPGEDKVPEESDSNQCYAGLTFESETSPQGVTCRRGYSRCYGGHGVIKTGLLSMSVLIKTCQQPSCVVPESQSFGPIEISQWGSCCLGSYCNGKETAAQIQNILKSTPTTGYYSNVTASPATSFTQRDAGHDEERIPPASGMPGRQLITNTQDPISESTIDYYYDDGWQYGGQPGPVGEAVRFQSYPFGPLLVAFGIAAFVAW